MTPQQKLRFSLAFIAVLLMFLLLPAEQESSPAGWVFYGIILGLLISVVIRSVSIISYQNNYKRQRTYRTRSR